MRIRRENKSIRYNTYPKLGIVRQNIWEPVIIKKEGRKEERKGEREREYEREEKKGRAKTFKS